MEGERREDEREAFAALWLDAAVRATTLRHIMVNGTYDVDVVVRVRLGCGSFSRVGDCIISREKF